MAEPMADRRIQQRQILAVLLAATALIIPVSGGAYYAGIAFPGGANGVILGAVGSYDLLPLLMLLGALAIVVVTRGRPRSTVASVTVALVLAASAVLAVGYLGSAFELRPDGPFDVAGDTSSMTGWSRGRLSAILSLIVPGVLCVAVFAYGLRWFAERRETVAP